MRDFVRAFRGELLQLRKWPAVWWLVAAMPAYMLVGTYLLYYLLTVTASALQVAPSAYGVSATVAILAPGQLVQVVTEFGYGTFGPVLALVLGALVVGTGLERGTTRSAALTGAGWVRVLLAQGLAVCLLLALSVVATYAVSAGASELTHVALGTPLPSTVFSFQPAGQLVHAIWIAMLISVCYGMIGCALAAIVRSPGTGIILGLFFIYGFEYLLGSLGTAIPALGKVTLYEPADSVSSLTIVFGQPGGGGAEMQNPPPAPAVMLGAWAVGSGLVLLAVGSLWRGHLTWRPRFARARASVQTLRPRGVSVNSFVDRWPRFGRVVVTVRSELFVLLRWPAVRGLLLCVVLYPWLTTYLTAFISYRFGGQGGPQSFVVPEFSAGQMLPQFLSDLRTGALWTGPTPLLLIGAWTGGSIWPGGQLRTSLTQWPRRREHVFGQCVALVLLTIGAAVLALAVAIVSVKLVALLLPHLAAIHTGGHYGTFPSVTDIIDALGAFTLATATYALLGLALGTALRNAAAALGVAFLWILGFEGLLAGLLPQTHGTLHRIAEALPDASLIRLDRISGLIAYGFPHQGATDSVATAVLQLAGWSAIAAIITIWLISRTEHA